MYTLPMQMQNQKCKPDQSSNRNPPLISGQEVYKSIARPARAIPAPTTGLLAAPVYDATAGAAHVDEAATGLLEAEVAAGVDAQLTAGIV